MIDTNILRGDIFYAEFKEDGHRQGGVRPCVVTSNDLCNKYSPVITVVPITSKLQKNNIPTHILLNRQCGLDKQSIALVEGITSFNKIDLRYKIGKCTDDDMQRIENAIKIQNGIEPIDYNKIFLIIAKLNENINYINKYNNDSKEYKHERDLLIVELHNYCKRWQIDFTNIKKMINLNGIGGRGGINNVGVMCS